MAKLKATLANGMDVDIPQEVEQLWQEWIQGEGKHPKLISLANLTTSESEAWANKGNPIDKWAFTKFNTHAVSVCVSDCLPEDANG